MIIGRIKDFRARAAVVISLLLSFFLLLFILFGYAYTHNMLRDSAGQSNRQIARLVADDIAGILDRQADLLRLISSDETILASVAESNSLYGAAGQSGTEDSPVRGYLNNPASIKLNSFLDERKWIVGILVTNKSGAMVAATYKDADFYQGNKDWWKASYGRTDGKFYVGNVIYDEVSGLWCIPISAPIKDRSSATVGVLRLLIDVKAFFAPMEDLKIGDNGAASLVDDNGYLIYQQGAKPFANKFCAYKELKKVFASKSNWLVMDGVYSRQGEVFISFSQVDKSLFRESGIKWYVFVMEDAQDVFAPLGRMMAQSAITGFILILLAALIIFISVDFLMRPITDIRNRIDRITRGELDCRIGPKNEEHLQNLADSINNMLNSLKNWAPGAANLDREIAQRKTAQEGLKESAAGFLAALSKVEGGFPDLRKELELILNEMPKSAIEKQKKLINALNSDIDSMSREVVKLMDFAGIESEKLVLNKKVVDIRSIIRSAVFEFEPRIRDKGIDFKLDAPKDPIEIYADSDKVTKAVNNIIENSIKFTSKGAITLAIRQSGDYVECSISDTGVGIKTQDASAIFQKFPGLGLYIAKVIIEAHDGKINIESPSGKGTKTTIKIPKYKKT